MLVSIRIRQIAIGANSRIASYCPTDVVTTAPKHMWTPPIVDDVALPDSFLTVSPLSDKPRLTSLPETGLHEPRVSYSILRKDPHLQPQVRVRLEWVPSSLKPLSSGRDAFPALGCQDLATELGSQHGRRSCDVDVATVNLDPWRSGIPSGDMKS